jgi:DNA-binding LytR/AlgR family response regulator
MKIAICEDNNYDADLLVKLVSELKGISATERFLSAEKLLESYAHGKRYDLVFMDIQMPGINGFRAAEILHSEYHQARPLIVFLTVTNKYVFDAYNVGWDYICKPINAERMQLLHARAQTEFSHRKIILPTKEGTTCFESGEVIYFESYYGVVNIITKQVKRETRLTLEKVLELLGNRSFCQTHRCYVINLRHVTMYSNNEVSMSTGKLIPLSRNRRKPFEQSFEDFHRGYYNG